VKTNCENCGSSDANHVYNDDNPRSHCFSCGITVFLNERKPMELIEDTDFLMNSSMIDEINTYRSYPMTSRGISQDVVDHFNVKMSVDINGKPQSHFYPYTINGELSAYKERKLPKEFRTHGDFKNVELFGQQQSTSGFTLVICEGEIDALSVAQAYKEKYGRTYSVVAVPSSSSTSSSL
jgi:ribosomal protein S27AE